MFVGGGVIVGCMGGNNDGCSSVQCYMIACCEEGRPFVPCCTAFGVSLVLGSSLALVVVSSRSTIPRRRLLVSCCISLFASSVLFELHDFAYLFVVVLVVACVAPCLFFFFCAAADVASFLANSSSNHLM